MEYIFGSDVIKGKKYKKILHYLCTIADKIYFTFYEGLMINEEILELGKECTIIDVPNKIRQQFDANVIGYEINNFIILYIFEKESLYDLLSDRMDGAVLFYNGSTEIIYIRLNDFRDIYIQTNDQELIKKFSDIENNYSKN